MSTTRPPTPSTAVSKPRSPVERALVWGFIAIGLIAVGAEAVGYYQHRNATRTLTEKMKAADEGDTSVKKSDVLAAVGRKAPDRIEDLTGRGLANGANTVEIYTWFTLNSAKPRELYVYYGHDLRIPGNSENGNPDVIEVATSRALTADEAHAANAANAGADTTPVVGGPSAPMGGMPGGGMMMPGRSGPGAPQAPPGSSTGNSAAPDAKDDAAPKETTPDDADAKPSQDSPDETESDAASEKVPE